MMNDEQYHEIRPFRNHEFGTAIEELLNMPQIDSALAVFYPNEDIKLVKEKIKSTGTVDKFQHIVIYDVLAKILKTTARSFSFSGVEQLRKEEPYLYVSNHRDIALDPSLISFALVENGFGTFEIAIGDNLVKEKWIKDLVRINKSFIVKRNLPPRELILASRLLSNYIYETLTLNNQSVWIAQREGRAKDGNDVTQLGLLGMLGMASKDGIHKHFLELNPVAVSISYEYDPTDSEKVRRIYAERYLGGYKKEHKEDENSMKNGIMGYKGRIHIHFSEPLSDKIKEIPADTKKAEFENQIRNLLDYQIISGYKLWPVNYICQDLFLGSDESAEHYTDKEKEAFVQEVEKKVAQMEGDKEKLRMIFYEIYARPAINAGRVSVSENIFNSSN